MQRQAAVAGQFYPGMREQLRTVLDGLVPRVAEKRRVLGIIAPHAGYIYSGAIAGTVYGQIAMPSSVLIMGPNHHGAGAAAALYPEGEWLTPLGAIAIDSRLTALLQRHVPFVEPDSSAHRFEHSLEVQVPFIQHVRSDAAMAALCLGHGDFSAVREIGRGIAAAVREYGEDVLIVASSDMTHYETADSARRKDELALARVLAFDPEGLLKVCHSEHITMCGVIPAAVMLVACRELGATRAEVAAYGNSGAITGDTNQVVGYAAVSVW
ncbi:AmmeMemoRadiSam system protein B [Geobacter sp. FeAm09]|uniref:AmmeMemoRadiSam system protein B n=1 Tax=Geobacter sp. FeAm09 TaxID=2597769 RepID=UPI0011EDC3AF|nr:AmmeMemoRadiSam system protein B [Geobacter sp. FeAm09]QEM68302.1 AmmeMemoRadiSam system protein B [Geobacter sp. FeAm09]